MPAGEAGAAILLKLLGSVAGAVLALVFLLPRTRREGLRRFGGSVVAGVIFAPVVMHYGAWSATPDNVVAASGAAAFGSWWVMGALVRIAGKWTPK